MMLFGWKLKVESSLEKDLDFYDDFHISVSIRSEGRCIANNILTRTKYPLTIEILNRRVLSVRLIKVVF